MAEEFLKTDPVPKTAAESGRSSAAQSPVPAAKPGTILIIEDNVGIKEMVSDVLEMAGYEATGVETVADARAKLSERQFDLALVDLVLPDGKGIDLVGEIRAFHPDTVVIIGTAHASVETAIAAINRGAYGYITKPYFVEALKHLVSQALEKRRLELENRRLLEELKIMNRDLMFANSELKNMDELKSAFVSNVSHEFKSPLSILSGWMDYLLEGLAGPLDEKVQKIVVMMGKTVKRLARLVKDILDIQKIEAGKMELKCEDVNLKELMEDVLQTYNVAFADKKLTLVKEVAEDVAFNGDRDRLSQAFINLLSNSIKYTPEGGQVTVRLKPTDEGIRAEFQDTGPGISKENMEKVFDKFTRVTEERIEGTGLGLPIARDIIRLHKGKVWVESELGKGSTFIISLPKSSTQLSAEVKPAY